MASTDENKFRDFFQHLQQQQKREKSVLEKLICCLFPWREGNMNSKSLSELSNWSDLDDEDRAENGFTYLVVG